MFWTTILVAAGTMMTAGQFGRSKRARLTNDLNNARQVKLALDAFAADSDGQFPNGETAEDYVEGGTGSASSNDYFRQLFLAGATASERIFWVQGASVCNKKRPDDDIKEGDRLSVKKILQAGDCGLAYMRDQSHLVAGGRPILLSAFTSGTKNFDTKLYGGKVIVARVDGAVKVVELDDKGHLLQNKEDILSSKSKIWEGSDPTKLLIQPQPVKAAAEPEKKKAK